MRRFLIGFLATVGALALLLALAGGLALWRYLPEPAELPERILLTADWRTAMAETTGAPDLLDLELRPRPTVTETVLALDAAAADPRVAGLLVDLSETSHGLAVAQELRDAVRRFRAAGKHAVAFADTFGELGAGNEGYYLATAFDEIDLLGIGLVGLTGLGAQVPLARDLLASLGVGFEVVRRAEYKTALESLTESELSGPNREQLEALLGTLSDQLAAGIAEGRNLTPGEARRLIERGPYSGEEALAAGLVDRSSPRDRTLEAALRRAGPGAAAVPLASYADQLDAPAAPAATVALVRAAGAIRRGGGPLGAEIAADELAGTLEDIAEDEALAAVVLRLDSGGGSAVASETIRHAVAQVRAAGKPVVVSMGNAAASGGYWIAAGADRIVAQPATLTGSIGVVAGKPVLEEAWRKLGIGWAEVGAEAGIWSVNRPYSPEARTRVDALVGWLYERFVEVVSDGRDLPPERVREIAKGRVWAGATAAGLGLVDELGGLDVALGATRRLLELAPDAPLAVEVRPAEDNPFRLLVRALRPLAAGLGTLSRLLDIPGTGTGTAVSLPVAVR